MEINNSMFHKEAYAFGRMYQAYDMYDVDHDMNMGMKKNKNKRAYQHIELWKRKELIECVNKKEETMKDCSKRLGINYCTAKHILKVYRKTGSFETDLMRKKKEKDEELKQRVLNDTQFAEFSANDMCRNLPLYSNKWNRQENLAIKHYDVMSENSQHNSDNSCVFEGELKMANPQPYYPVPPQAQYYNPNYLFEYNNMNNLGNYAQTSNGNSLEDIWAYLGDLVYAKHSN